MIANGYDPTVRAYSTGSILHAEVFEDAFDQKIEFVHMGYGDSGYKSEWGVNVHSAQEDWIAFSPSIHGRVLHAAMRIKQWVSALLRIR
jgi:CelD/BcsL family acetyltransferase involved in cellulose biosynthesis